MLLLKTRSIQNTGSNEGALFRELLINVLVNQVSPLSGARRSLMPEASDYIIATQTVVS